MSFGVGTRAMRGAPGAVPNGALSTAITGTSVALTACIAAAVANTDVPVAITELDDGVCVCVSFVPDMNAVICRDPAIVLNGASVASGKGRSLPVAAVACPGAWNANVDEFAAAMSLCGHSSWNHAKPPLPAMM